MLLAATNFTAPLVLAARSPWLVPTPAAAIYAAHAPTTRTSGIVIGSVDRRPDDAPGTREVAPVFSDTGRAAQDFHSSRNPSRGRIRRAIRVGLRALATFQAAWFEGTLTQGIGLRPQPWASSPGPLGRYCVTPVMNGDSLLVGEASRCWIRCRRLLYQSADPRPALFLWQ